MNLFYVHTHIIWDSANGTRAGEWFPQPVKLT